MSLVEKVESSLITQLGGAGSSMSKAQLLVSLLQCGVREQSPLFKPIRR